jgi:helix-turn-helix protein
MSEKETAPTRERRGREHSATSSNVQGDSTKPRAYVHRWRSAVFNDATLSTSKKMTLLALGEYANPDGSNCKPSAVSLGKLCGLHERTVRRVLDEARKDGWMRLVVHREGVPSTYSLTLPPNADTRPARARNTSATPGAVTGVDRSDPGHSVHEPRALCAATPGVAPGEQALEQEKTTGKERPDAGASVADGLSREKGESSQARTTFKTWWDSIPEDVDTFAEDDPVFAYARKLGLSIDFLDLAWRTFSAEKEHSPAQSADWRAVFRRHVRKDYFGLWTLRGGAFHLTTRGKQAAIEHDMRDLLADAERTR